MCETPPQAWPVFDVGELAYSQLARLGTYQLMAAPVPGLPEPGEGKLETSIALRIGMPGNQLPFACYTL